jgi:hypothetical protein
MRKTVVTQNVVIALNQNNNLLLQVRIQVLNGALGQIFRHWYPDFRAANDENLKKVA